MKQQTLRDDDAVQEAARNLFLGCAPEQKAQLNKLWQDFSPKFQLTEDVHEGRHVIMEAGAYRYVWYNHRVMRFFWVAAYAAWEGYEAAHRSLTANTPLDLKRFESLVAACEKIILSQSPALESLPPGVAEPGIYPDAKRSPEGRATAELATFAAAWPLLHEIHHLQRQQQGTSADPNDPIKCRAEELSCDRFATQFLLKGVDKYAVQEHVAPDRVLLKRQLGIYFGLFGLTLLTRDNWGDSDSHPAVQKRINHVHKAMERRRSEHAYAIAHVAFASLRSLWPSVPGPF